MTPSVELGHMARDISEALVSTVNKLGDVPLTSEEEPAVRKQAFNRVASREANFIAHLKRLLITYESTPSESLEKKLLQAVTACNDHMTYLNALVDGGSDVMRFQVFFATKNDYRKNVASSEAIIANDFLTAIYPILNAKNATNKAPVVLEAAIMRVRKSQIEAFLKDTSISHGDLTFLKAMLVRYSIKKVAAVEEVESRAIPSSFQIKNFSYGRNLLLGLCNEFRQGHGL